MEKIKLGVSTCLLGEKVRYDGGHKLDPFIKETLGRFVEYVPVCPEVECGLSVPREAMHLVGDPESPRLMTIKTGRDFTQRMLSWGRTRVEQLEDKDLCGFIFKSKSPSSGMERVRVYGENGRSVKNGVGIWAGLFMNHFPLLPVEEDGRLHDPLLREMFIEKIFVMKRWRETMTDHPTLGGLVNFHTRHKLLIMSHSPEIYRKLGHLVATAKGRPIGEIAHEYLSKLFKALALKTTVKKNVNVLQHIVGYFKKQLDVGDKEEFAEILSAYKAELVPLIVPVTLLNHYVRQYNQSYLMSQYYLNPHPLELKLRNHV